MSEVTPELERLTYRSESGHAHFKKNYPRAELAERLCEYEELQTYIIKKYVPWVDAELDREVTK